MVLVVKMWWDMKIKHCRCILIYVGWLISKDEVWFSKQCYDYFLNLTKQWTAFISDISNNDVLSTLSAVEDLWHMLNWWSNFLTVFLFVLHLIYIWKCKSEQAILYIIKFDYVSVHVPVCLPVHNKLSNPNHAYYSL